MSHRLLYLLVILPILGCSIGLGTTSCSPDNSGTTSSEAVPRVVVIGSSSAYGRGASTPQHAYAARLSSWLATNDPTSCLVNLAQNGYTTFHLRPLRMGNDSGRSSIDSTRNIDAAIRLSPELVIIHLPSNDIAYGYPLASSIRNIQAMVDDAHAAGMRVLVIGPHPRGNADCKRDSMVAWARALDTLSNAETISVWDSLATDSTHLRAAVNSDGVHFNDSGHAIVYRQILRSRSWTALFSADSAK